MKQKILTTTITLFALFLAMPAIQAETSNGQGKVYIDADNDGFNDNAPDHDGDGIPNGLDEDYIKQSQDGSGKKYQKGRAEDGS